MSNSLVWEVLRKLVHLSGLLIVVGYTLLLHFFNEQIAILAMTALLLVLLEIEYIRLERKSRITAVFDGLFRIRERDNISGAVFLVISCIICFSVFDYWIAVVAMFMTVFGDLFAALIGKTLGKTIICNNKTIVGTLAGLTANVGIGLLILYEIPYVVMAMAVVATITEMLTNKMDDNLTVPLFAGFTGQMLVYLFNLTLPTVDFSSYLGVF